MPWVWSSIILNLFIQKPLQIPNASLKRYSWILFFTHCFSFWLLALCICLHTKKIFCRKKDISFRLSPISILAFFLNAFVIILFFILLELPFADLVKNIPGRCNGIRGLVMSTMWNSPRWIPWKNEAFRRFSQAEKLRNGKNETARFI